MNTNNTNTTRTVIKGAPRQFDMAELQLRQQHNRTTYQASHLSYERVSAPIAKDFLQLIADKLNTGYALSPFPINWTGGDYNTLLLKTAKEQESDMATLDILARADYIEELEKEHERFKQLLTQQLLEAEQAKQDKKAAAEKAKLLAAIKTEVDSCYTPLTIPKA